MYISLILELSEHKLYNLLVLKLDYKTNQIDHNQFFAILFIK